MYQTNAAETYFKTLKKQRFKAQTFCLYFIVELCFNMLIFVRIGL